MGVKYYYTDPLAAAWMAKHFGMEFISYSDGLIENNNPIGFTDNFFVIHPDSLHKLEPQEEDLVCYVEYSQEIQKDGSPHKLVESYYLGAWKPTIKMGGIIYQNHYKKIIERNGIPFHWPEFE